MDDATWTIMTVLTLTAAIVRTEKDGWINEATAKKLTAKLGRPVYGTAGRLARILEGTEDPPTIVPDDAQTARHAMGWFRWTRENLDELNRTNNHADVELAAALAAFTHDGETPRDLVPEVYMSQALSLSRLIVARHHAAQGKYDSYMDHWEDVKDSEHVGQEGDLIEDVPCRVILVKKPTTITIPVKGDPRMVYRIVLVDEAGDAYLWFRDGHGGFQAGQRVRIRRARVGKHTVWKGAKMTRLKYAKITNW